MIKMGLGIDDDETDITETDMSKPAPADDMPPLEESSRMEEVD